MSKSSEKYYPLEELLKIASENEVPAKYLEEFNLKLKVKWISSFKKEI